MGAVYQARQRGLGRLVALKILPAEYSQTPGFAERFTREARALAQLNHPHIVTVHDFGQAGGLCYLLMEFVDGLNLRQVIQTGVPEPQHALSIIPQICEALQYAHEEGVVHRDIKPENILLDKRGRVKIADFGLAKLLGKEHVDSGLTHTQQVMGTLRYMAPEQMAGAKAVDHRADIYSLGVVFYELLTGEVPVGRFAPPSKKVQVDVRLDEVVLRTLESEPEQRYQRASDVKSDVDAFRTAVAAAPNDPHRLVSDAAFNSGKSHSLQVLFIGAMLLLSLLIMGAGVAFAAIGFAFAPTGSGQFWGYMGAALGCFLGGGGSLLGCWNSYRQLEGAPDLLRAPRWTWFDTAVGLLSVSGLVASIVAVNAYFYDFGAVRDGEKPYREAPQALATLGAILLLQGLTFLGYRAAIRADAQESGGAAAKHAAESTSAARAWRDRPWLVKMFVYLGLSIIYLLGFLAFISIHGQDSATGHAHTVGAPTPWLVFNRTNASQSFYIVLGSWSWLALAAAFGALGTWRWLERLDKGRAHSLWWHVPLWLVCPAINLAMIFSPSAIRMHATPTDNALERAQTVQRQLPEETAAKHAAID
jgi:predicted Ser/Thr protein kinase